MIKRYKRNLKMIQLEEKQEVYWSNSQIYKKSKFSKKKKFKERKENQRKKFKKKWVSRQRVPKVKKSKKNLCMNMRIMLIKI